MRSNYAMQRSLDVMSNVISFLTGRRKKPTTPKRDVGALVTDLGCSALHVVRTSGTSRSYLGGDPQLPRNLTWPQKSGTPLRFLARLSLTDLQMKLPTHWLPKEGALLFFYDYAQQPWGFTPTDRGGWAVVLVPDAPAVASVSDPELENAFPQTPVELRPLDVLPSYERPQLAALKLSDAEFDEYFQFAENRFEGLPKHQLLGLPSPVQGDAMELECQLASNGVNCGGPEGYASPEAKQLAPGADEWRLLFQMDSDDSLGVMWGDCGHLYFWVQESAASIGDFDNVWLVLQCT